MFTEIFKTIRGIKPFFLLVIFFTLSLMVFDEGVALLDNPIAWRSLLIPFMACFAYGLAWGWVFFVIKASHILPQEDLANLGFLVACSVMVFALLITFSYLSNNHGSISLEIFKKPEFIYTCTLYIMSMVAFDVAAS
ncbi:hypothetical protein SAMN04487958_11928 [Vreelandella subterranea]|uniref:Uncharacterized protein n=1 Tax=Vreelandella subterranea TaxID=416874 RepID=A0A1H9WQ63_9GAMM|nr:hypothetical protein [Halomonas subterranea]SES36005.1 hypothetical protein SAMN04487958_11928 [Halomonas subterranea]